ncbi:MAG TPA: NADH-quinone oxidoreductase subunit N [Thermoanaerobaculia bacterium]|nr:NADH-quinone oxidoreductase subunit N [Thermoanaerobaculia bacterium]
MSGAALLADLASLGPELMLSGAGILVVLLDAMAPRLTRLWVPLALLAAAAAGVSLALDRWGAGESFGGFVERTPVTTFLSLVVLLAGALALMASQAWLRRERIGAGEYAALMLWCMVGLLLMVRAVELLTLFLALELLSFCLYALAAYHRRLPMASEAGLKYFLMGAFVSAFVLLGIALLYGETGSTRLALVAAEIARGGATPVLVTLGFLLLVAGFGFKMSLAPFHAWAPDTYQGAPSPFVAFLSVAPKVAAAFVLVRLLLALGEAGLVGDWRPLVAFLAVLSMAVGNLLALVQKDIKRMLAYSGIAHMGYLLIPLVVLDAEALQAILVYLLAYALMNAGAFAVVALLFARPGEQHLISELSGWGYRFPFLGFCLTVCLLSLGGIPPTLGFLGKYFVFAHAIGHGALWLAVVGIAASLVGIVYYLRVVYVLYMKPEVAAPEGLLIDSWGRLSVALAAAGTLVLGLFPAWLLGWLQRATSGL